MIFYLTGPGLWNELYHHDYSLKYRSTSVRKNPTALSPGKLLTCGQFKMWLSTKCMNRSTRSNDISRRLPTDWLDVPHDHSLK